MNVSLPSFSEQKNEVELSLARTIVTQLEQGKISFEKSREIAQYILDGVGKTHDFQTLLKELQALSQEWPMFESTTGLYRLKVKDEVETKEDLRQTQEALQAIGGGQ